MKLEVSGSLYQRYDSILTVRLHVSEAAQIGEVQRTVSQRFHRGVVVRGNHQIDLAPHLLGQVVAKGSLLLDRNLCGSGIGDHSYSDWLVSGDDHRDRRQ